MRDILISVVIPVYNVEKYLEQTLNSVINQSIGIKKMQIILVNDGSSDNSEEICLKYVKMYPNNVEYISKKNEGVSCARNDGMKVSVGKYINFMDSDDYIDPLAYEMAIDFLEKNDDVDVASFRVKFFEKIKSYHNLDYKFEKGNRLVDLSIDYDNPTYHIPTLVIRSNVALKYSFDKRLSISEDVKYVSDVLSEHGKVYLIKDCVYYYRKRKEVSSAIQTSLFNYKYYFDTPNYSFYHVLDLAKKNKKLSKYYMNVLVSDLYWRLFDINLTILNEDEKKKYVELIRNLYKKIDDELIVNRYYKDIISKYKNIRCLEFKYNKVIYKDLYIKDESIFYNDIKLFDKGNIPVEVYYLNINNDEIVINTRFSLFLNSHYDMFIKCDNKYVKMNMKSIPEDNNLYNLDSKYNTPFYDIRLKLKDLKNISFYIKINDEYISLLPIYTKFSRINMLKNSYFRKNGYLISHDKYSIFVNRKKCFMFFRYIFELLFKEHEILSFGILLLYSFSYPFVKHDNWIVSDRFDVAGDNGEWMFKYLVKHSNKSNIYFGLRKGSSDEKRMSKFGKIIHFKTIKYYIKYLNSEFVISSHIDNYIHKPFGRKQIYINPFLDRKYVFLQHGVTKSDISKWLYKYNRCMDLFICCAKREYDSIINGNYLYDGSVVKLTGFARYDNLLNSNIKEENIIALMPTWRSKLAGSIITGSQNREYNPKFKETEYYKFYNNLINDKRILDCLKKNNYKILFCVHPSFKSQFVDFEDNEYVNKIIYVDYPSVFKKAKLMITDYSSVYFDFAYLKKPILYTPFDKKYVSSIHFVLQEKNSFFDIEKDGFGDVLFEYEKIVKRIIDCVNNGCFMEKKYEKRVDEFFEYHDNNNCKRIYDEIKAIQEKL